MSPEGTGKAVRDPLGGTGGNPGRAHHVYPVRHKAQNTLGGPTEPSGAPLSPGDLTRTFVPLSPLRAPQDAQKFLLPEMSHWGPRKGPLFLQGPQWGLEEGAKCPYEAAH